MLNIMNAYNDERFNKDTDVKNNYKTNSILCVPIFDKSENNVIGIIYFHFKQINLFFF